MNRFILPVVLVVALLQGLVLFVLAFVYSDIYYLKQQANNLPAQIDLLVSAGDKTINLDCPECPPCKDYTPDFDKLRKSLEANNAPQGYYYYGGCR